MPYLPTFEDFELEPTEEKSSGGSVSSSPRTPEARLRVAVRALRQMKEQLTNVIESLEGNLSGGVDAANFRMDEGPSVAGNTHDSVVEGVFDGERMMGTDGMKYLIPPNYASKSKLVEGDILKLTIKEDGSFIYKQIAPIDRERVTGKLAVDESGNYGMQLVDGKVLRILTASVTFFRGDVGDEVVALVPKGHACTWAAVEHILKR